MERLFSLDFRDVGRFTVYLPFYCMIGSLCYAFSFYFDEVTESKCGVHNFVPSISGAVCMRPLLHWWRFCIIIHAVPRFVIAYLYYFMHMQLSYQVKSWDYYNILVLNTFLLDLTNILSLCGLSLVSTVDNFRKVPVSILALSCSWNLFHCFWNIEFPMYGFEVLYTHWITTPKSFASCSMFFFDVKNRLKFKQSLEDKAYFLVLMIISALFAAKHYYEHHVLCLPNGNWMTSDLIFQYIFASYFFRFIQRLAGLLLLSLVSPSQTWVSMAPQLTISPISKFLRRWFKDDLFFACYQIAFICFYFGLLSVQLHLPIKCFFVQIFFSYILLLGFCA